MANVLTVQKVTALPATVTASTMYLVPNATAGYLDIYVTSSDATTTNKIVTKQDVGAGNSSVTTIVATYSALSAITPTVVEIAYVKDASGDTSVTPAITGGAMYIWDTTLATPAWVLMDTSIQNWSSIVGVPAVLTGLTDMGGFLAYNATIIPTYLATEAW